MGPHAFNGVRVMTLHGIDEVLGVVNGFMRVTKISVKRNIMKIIKNKITAIVKWGKDLTLICYRPSSNQK